MEDDRGTQRTLGSLDARMSLMEVRMSTLETRIDARLNSLDLRLGQVHEAIIGARGSWRAVMWLIGAGTSVGALVAAFAHWILPK